MCMCICICIAAAAATILACANRTALARLTSVCWTCMACSAAVACSEGSSQLCLLLRSIRIVGVFACVFPVSVILSTFFPLCHSLSPVPRRSAGVHEQNSAAAAATTNPTLGNLSLLDPRRSPRPLNVNPIPDAHSEFAV